jgi:hypothetical protein
MSNTLSINTQLIRLLAASVWISAFLFGLYIIGFYALALVTDDAERWNRVLPGLYVKGNSAATQGIGIHFLGGGIVLLLGCLQLMAGIRNRWPILHRAIGRLYLIGCLFASLGGLLFVILNRTIGGWPMDLAFTMYGALMFICSIQTWRYAIKRKIAVHKAWAIRLFALAIGSWFYRMGYGFWFLTMDGVGHTETFSGGFDYFMDFFFFLPNLLFAEAIIRGVTFSGPWMRTVSATGLVCVILYVWVATYFFTTEYWSIGIGLLVRYLGF